MLTARLPFAVTIVLVLALFRAGRHVAVDFPFHRILPEAFWTVFEEILGPPGIISIAAIVALLKELAELFVAIEEEVKGARSVNRQITWVQISKEAPVWTAMLLSISFSFVAGYTLPPRIAKLINEPAAGNVTVVSTENGGVLLGNPGAVFVYFVGDVLKVSGSPAFQFLLERDQDQCPSDQSLDRAGRDLELERGSADSLRMLGEALATCLSGNDKSLDVRVTGFASSKVEAGQADSESRINLSVANARACQVKRWLIREILAKRTVGGEAEKEVLSKGIQVRFWDATEYEAMQSQALFFDKIQAIGDRQEEYKATAGRLRLRSNIEILHAGGCSARQ